MQNEYDFVKKVGVCIENGILMRQDQVLVQKNKQLVGQGVDTKILDIMLFSIAVQSINFFGIFKYHQNINVRGLKVVQKNQNYILSTCTRKLPNNTTLNNKPEKKGTVFLNMRNVVPNTQMQKQDQIQA